MKLRKIFFMTCLLLLIINFDGVYANEGDPTCTYKTNNPPATYKTNTVIDVWLEKGKLKASCSDDLIRKEFLDYTTINEGCSILDKNVSSLFTVENGILYCPSNVNLNLDGRYIGTAAISYSLAIDASEYSSMLSKPTISGGAIGYNSEKNGKLSKCATGGESKISAYQSKIDTYKAEIAKYDEKLTKKIVEEMNEKINTLATNLINANYCNPKINKMGVQIDSLLTTLDKKVSSSTTMTSEQKSDASQSVAATQAMVGTSLSKIGKIIIDDSDNVYECQGLLGDKLIDILKAILKIIQIAAPILTIILGSLDFGSVVISQDQDAMKKATSKFVKRCIAAVAIFFIPYLVGVLLSMDGVSNWESVDPNCGL